MAERTEISALYSSTTEDWAPCTDLLSSDFTWVVDLLSAEVANIGVWVGACSPPIRAASISVHVCHSVCACVCLRLCWTGLQVCRQEWSRSRQDQRTDARKQGRLSPVDRHVLHIVQPTCTQRLQKMRLIEGQRTHQNSCRPWLITRSTFTHKHTHTHASMHARIHACTHSRKHAGTHAPASVQWAGMPVLCHGISGLQALPLELLAEGCSARL